MIMRPASLRRGIFATQQHGHCPWCRSEQRYEPTLRSQIRVAPPRQIKNLQGLDWMPTNIDRRDFVQTGRPPLAPDSPVSDQDVEEFKGTVLAKLTLAVGKDAASATDRDWFVATALAVRDRIIHRWLTVDRASYAQGRKRVYYMSLEVLIGRLLNDVVGN